MLEQQTEKITNQQTWDDIVNILNTAAESTLGFKERTKKHIDHIIADLSWQQKQLDIQINATKSDELKNQLKIQINRLLTDIHNRLKEEENNKIKNTLKTIENTSDNNIKMYEAVKNLNRLKPKQYLLLQSEHGLTANEDEQTKIIAKYIFPKYLLPKQLTGSKHTTVAYAQSFYCRRNKISSTKTKK